jgi:hypothetical protein
MRSRAGKHEVLVVPFREDIASVETRRAMDLHVVDGCRCTPNMHPQRIAIDKDLGS